MLRREQERSRAILALGAGRVGGRGRVMLGRVAYVNGWAPTPVVAAWPGSVRFQRWQRHLV